VDPGNFVQTTDTTGLFVLNTTNPTTVVFTLAEDFIPPVLNQMRAGKKLIVDAFDRTQNRLLATGNLLAIDSQIDPSTGTVKLKALFKNENDILYPSQFVNVRLRVDTLKDATVIPTSALLQGKENYVFIINQGENIARIKPVQVGITFGEYSVINTTLDPKNLIIAEGTDNLKDGSKVRFEQKENPLKRSTP
jgi:multidrug efflux system membrane fusion protein